MVDLIEEITESAWGQFRHLEERLFAGPEDVPEHPQCRCVPVEIDTVGILDSQTVMSSPERVTESVPASVRRGLSFGGVK